MLAIAMGCGKVKGQEDVVPEKEDGPKPFAAGTVKETMVASQYTYVLIDTGGPEIWAAGPKTDVNVGDRVQIPGGMMMKNFHSKTLDRTFEEIYFVGGMAVGDGGSQPKSGMPAGHPDIKDRKAVDFSGIKKARGGKTIAEVHAQKDKLVGKTVKIQAKVTKFTPEIMGKNWLHIEDGSTDKDLTVMTMGTADVGDTVTVSGTVAADKDFGYGYKYDIMIEDAKL